MEFNKILWSSSEFDGIRWNSLDFFGIQWNSMEFHGEPWNPMESFENPSKNSIGFFQIPWRWGLGWARQISISRTAGLGGPRRGRAGQREPAEIYKKRENL